MIIFHISGVCDSWEYNCDNGRCIDNSLTCNGYNSCGDYSDCDSTAVTLTSEYISAVFFFLPLYKQIACALAYMNKSPIFRYNIYELFFVNISVFCFTAYNGKCSLQNNGSF